MRIETSEVHTSLYGAGSERHRSTRSGSVAPCGWGWKEERDGKRDMDKGEERTEKEKRGYDGEHDEHEVCHEKRC